LIEATEAMRRVIVAVTLLVALGAEGTRAQDRDFRRDFNLGSAQILAGDQYDGPRARLSQEFTLTRDGLLIASATATATYYGRSATAGVIVSISINESSCAQDQSIASGAQSATFHANAVCIRWLPPGDYRITVVRSEENADESPRLAVSFYVLAVSGNR
jgi:hypothetical protein